MALSRKFHWVTVNRDRTPEIPKQLNVSAYPSLLVLGRDLENVHRFQSFKKPDAFLLALSEGLRRYALYRSGKDWDLPTPRARQLCSTGKTESLPAPSSKVPSGIVGWDGGLLVAQSDDLFEIDARSGAVRKTLKLPASIQDIASDGRQLYAVEAGWTSGGPIHVLEPGRARSVRQIVTEANAGNKGSGARGICYRNGKLYVLHIFGKVFELNPESGKLLRTFDIGKRWVYGLAFDGKHFVVGARAAMYLVDPASFRVVREVPMSYGLRAVGFANGRYWVMEQPVFGHDRAHRSVQVWPRPGQTRVYRIELE